MSKSDSYTDAYFYLQNIRRHVKDLLKKKKKFKQLTEYIVIENISRFRIQQSTHKTLNCMVFPYHTITQSFKKLSINSKTKFVVRLFFTHHHLTITYVIYMYYCITEYVVFHWERERWGVKKSFNNSLRKK